MVRPKKQLESVVDKCADEKFCGGDCSESEAENENELESKEKNSESSACI